MLVGDLIEGYMKDMMELEWQWEEFIGFMAQLQMLFFYVLGNYDIINEVMEWVYLEWFGQMYYYFIYKDVLFFCFNFEDQYWGFNWGMIFDE